MVKYIDWGKHIRLGNWLFIYAGVCSILKDTSNPFAPAPYFLWKYLEHPPFVTDNERYSELFHFRTTQYSDEEKAYLKEFFTQKRKDGITVNINIGSHLQSERWFIEDLDYVKSKLKFREDEVKRVKDKYSTFFSKKTIGVGIRRGDFVGHGDFFQIPINWYEEAIEKNFPDAKDHNIIIFSDDIEWCKEHFKDKGYFFAEPNNTHTHADNFKHYHNDPMEQFILGTLCDNFVGGNSTFSWWQSWYVKNFNNGKVVHCGKNLSEANEQRLPNPDFYPASWVLHAIT